MKSRICCVIFPISELYAKVLSKDFLHNIDTESFRSFLFQARGAAAVAHHARPKQRQVHQIFLDFKEIFLKND